MTTPKNQNKRGVHLPPEDWSEFASGIGPDTRQPEMVSKQRVLDLIDMWRSTWTMTALDLRDEVEKL